MTASVSTAQSDPPEAVSLLSTLPAGRIPLAERHRSRRTFRSGRERWQARYASRVFFGDLIVLCVAVYSAQIIRFDKIGDTADLAWMTRPGIDYTAVSGVLVLLWLAMLGLVNSRATGILGRGVEEYRRIVSATFMFFGVLSIFFALLLNVDFDHGYLAISLSVGGVGLLIGRKAWRRIAIRGRTSGKYQTSLLVVANEASAAGIAQNFVSDPKLGFRIVGLCTPDGPSDEHRIVNIADQLIPIVGTDTTVMEAVKKMGADTVAIAPTKRLGPAETRRLMWDLEALGVDLIVTAGLIDTADNRISCQPVAGMAILYVEKPQYDRANSWTKRAFDIVFTVAALIAFAPFMIGAAIAVRASSAGPVFYLADRIGIDGKTFKMYKFRSMYIGSDAQQSAMIGEAGGNALFFKVKDDRRVTPVGRVMRKFSIDELPQFFNVLRGEMSVVGPRPQVQCEVESYDDLMRTRLFVRPGVTGLWQVSGRSDLSIEDSVRLDMSYVENWSMGLDLAIIARTTRVVALGSGAY